MKVFRIMNSKLLKADVLSLPYVMSKRQDYCCLICGLWSFRFHESFIKFVLTSTTTVDDILITLDIMQDTDLHLNDSESDDDSALLQHLRRMTPSRLRALTAICDSITDLHGHENLRITHRFYYQKPKIEIMSPVNQPAVSVGEIKRGQVLEIFQTANYSDLVIDVLEQLKLEFTKVQKQDFEYPGVVTTIQDRCIWIKFGAKTLEIIWQVGGGNITMLYDLNLNNLEGILMNLLRFENVAVIIVENLGSLQDNAEVPDVPKIKNWLLMLDRVHGGAEDLILAFVITYDDFLEFGLTSKAAVRKMVNEEITRKERAERVRSLDVSSISDSIVEEDGELALRIKRIDVDE